MTNLAPASDLVTCLACSARNSEGLVFCQQCGQRMFDENQPAPRTNPHLGTIGAAPGIKRPSIGHLAGAQHGRGILSARVAIVVVAVLAVISAVIYWMMSART